MPILSALWPTLVGIAVLGAITTAVLAGFGAPHRWAPVLAILRGAAQLAAISLVLAGVITDPRWVALALVVMFVVAAATATRRIGWSRDHAVMIVVAMGAGVAVSLGIVFATGTLQPTARYALAMGGIVIGNAMTTATLAGRRFVESVGSRWDEVEGWLALGAPPRRATLDIARNAVYGALIPSVDQTKTTGLVTLPGAFVGAIFGGVSPLEAGRFQVVVLAAIMGTGSIAAVIIARWLGPVRQRPAALR